MGGELGFWESLVGTQSFAHCGSLTLTFGHGEGEKRFKSLLFFSAVSYHTNYLPLLTILRDSSH